MKIILQLLIIFVAGMVFANNLSDLVETNPVWEASWWKAYYSLGIAIGFSAIVYFKKK